ncbi:hypothetical protein N9D26_00175 [bacterium]|nr:hypothetical protein [bacterium]
MKKLFLLSALFVFTFGFGQNSGTFNFDDIKDINTVKIFKKFCFEKEFVKVEDNEGVLTYAKGYQSDKKTANVWAHYSINEDLFILQFSRNYFDSSHPSFQKILNYVKKQCKFYDFKDNNGDEYICYSCLNSSFKGKIGFLRDKDGGDYVRTFDF